MADPKTQLKKGFARGQPPNNNNSSVETAENVGGSPPNVNPKNELEYVYGQPPRPPVITGTAMSPSPSRKPGIGQIGGGTNSPTYGANYRVALPDGRWVNAENKKAAVEIARGAYGNNYPTQAIFEIVQPQPQTQPQKTATLARTTTRTISQPLPQKPIYSPEDQKRVELYTRISEALPEDTQAEQLKQQVAAEAENNVKTAAGPIPKENIHIVAQMYGQLRNFIYERNAEYNAAAAHHVGRITGHSYESAIAAQERQLYAIRYGMSSLVNLHQGLDLASWNFFFNSLGPFGSLLEKYHGKEIAFNMAYYGGRSPLSPEYLHYVISELPKEKTVDILLDSTSNLLYFVGKHTNLSLFEKPVDRFGRTYTNAKPVFKPLLKFQGFLNKTTSVLETLGTETSVMPLYKSLDEIEADMDAWTPKLEDYIRPHPDTYLALASLQKKRAEILNKIAISEAKYKKRFLFGIFPLGKLSKKEAVDTFRAKIIRTLLPKKFLRKVREPNGDVLSWIAGILGQWIFEVTVGNIVRAIVEKLSGTEVWVKISRALDGFVEKSSFLRTSRLTFSTVGDFIKAGPSLNTLSGGYLGYSLGGNIGKFIANSLGFDPIVGQTIGQSVGLGIGGGVGWSYQWVLNMSNNTRLMNWVNNYENLQNEIYSRQSEIWKKISKGGMKISDADVQALKQDIRDLQLYKENYLKNFLGEPGKLQRFARWLNSPGGRFFRIPFKGFAASSVIEQLRAAGLIMPDWYQWWMPPTAQWLWEVKGPLVDLLGKAGIRIWGKIAFEEGSIVTSRMFTQMEFNSFKILSEGGGYRIISFEEKVVGGELQYIVKYGKLNGLFTQLNKLYFNALQRPLNFLSKLKFQFSQTSVGTMVKNLFNPGFFIGMELASLWGLPWYLLPVAGIAGSLGYSAITWGLWNIAQWLPGQLGISWVAEPFSLFLGRASLGGFLGWGVGTIVEAVWGIPGAGLWGNVIGSLTFALLPVLYSLVASFLPAAFTASITAIGGAVGAFSTGLLAGLGISATWAGVAVVGGVAIVVALAVFAIIIVGSAYWIPISETLEGITATSRCFSINQPTFNGTTLTAFKKGDKKDICWKSTVKEEYFPDAIAKTKILSPSAFFSVGGHSVTIYPPYAGGQGYNLIDGQSTIPDKNGKQVTYRVGYSPSSNSGFYSFSITPPADTSGHLESLTKDSLQQLATSLQAGGVANYSKNATGLVAQMAVNDAVLNTQRILLFEPQLELLKQLSTNPNLTDQEIEAAKSAALTRIGSDKDSLLSRILSTAYGGIKNDIDTTIQDCKNTVSNICQGINQSLAQTNNLEQTANGFYAAVGGYTPEQVQQEIARLKNTIKTIQGNGDSVKQEAQAIRELQDTLLKYGPDGKINPNDTQTALEQKIASLANSQTQGKTLYKIPAGTVIEVCLKDVVYSGETTNPASVMESDAANLPYTPSLGPLPALTVPSCRASLSTPLNAGPSGGQISWPVGQRPDSLSSDYRFDGSDGANNHAGIDIAVPSGTEVLSVVNGTVVARGVDRRNFGAYIIIRGDNNDYYLYAHLGGRQKDEAHAFAENTAPGSSVGAGQVLGYSDATGRVIAINGGDGSHLHFGMSTSGELSSFYNNNQGTTINPCLVVAGGCP